MNKSLYSRINRMIFPRWPYLVISLFAALIYVVLNSASIWLTASLINHILTDFDELRAEHLQNAGKVLIGLNEKLKYWSNEFILQETALQTLKVLCITIIGVFIVKNIFLYLKSITLSLVQFHLIKDLRNKLNEHFHSLSIAYFNQKKSGELTALVINDVTNINKAFGASFHQLLVEPINILAFLVLLFVINWKLTLIALIIIPVAGFAIMMIGRSIRRKSRRTAAKIAGITNIITETLSSIRVVKAFGMEEYEMKRFQSETLKYFYLLFRRAKLRLLASPTTETIGIVLGVSLLWYGGQEVLTGTGMTSEDFLRFIFLLFAMLDPLRKLSNVNVEIQAGAASLDRVFEILDTPPQIVDISDPVTIESFENRILFDHVHFHYEGKDNAVLNDISFEIEKGTVVALVGPSGAGKSTIADLIPRFYDVTKGSIEMDGNDIRNVSIRSLRKQLGIVTQETILFNDTILSNIAYGQSNINFDQVREAARVANAVEFIEKQSNKFETIIGDKGIKLSGGQRQRIAIARAVLKNPPILILDEATSALDTESERLVQDAMEKLMKDRTVLVIAHRLSTVMNAHKIIVLDRGKIVESGTHAELMKTVGLYHHLYNIQFSNKPIHSK